MTDTLTYNPTDPDAGELTPDEQDSLQVGEKLAEQEEKLLAGKYKNAEELEKAYTELEKKLGSDSQQKETPEAESTDEPQYYLEDGVVNYDAVNDAYGEKLGEVFKDSNIDPWAISEHFHSNNGKITDEMYADLEGAGLSRASIDAYLAGRAAASGYTDTSDIAERDINIIQDSVGGEKAYSKLIDWAGSNLDEKAINAFDSTVSSGNVQMIKLAVAGLKAEYDSANGYEGRMLSGKAAQTSGDVFRSQAEVVAAMSDPRYDKDPAYRNDIYEKLDRSDLKF